MKPLGTITQCFPHFDKGIRTVLQTIMDEAENYADFGKRLWEKACTEELPPICRYFVFYHEFRLEMYPQMEHLLEYSKVIGSITYVSPNYF